MIEPVQTVGIHDDAERLPPDDIAHLFLGSAVDQIGTALFGLDWKPETLESHWVQVSKLLARSFRAGDVLTYHHLYGFMRIPPEEWHIDEVEILAIFQSNKSYLLGSNTVGSRHWVFVDRRGLDALLFEITGPTPGRSIPFEFRMDEQHWRLFDAAIWVAAEGGFVTTGEIVQDRLSEVGSRSLFAKLAGLGYGGPKVTGLGAIEIRTQVLRSLWERAHTGWLGPGAGHRVRFFPDRDGSGQISSDLTMNNGVGPTWFDLRIDRRELHELFPKSVSVDKKDTGGPNTAKQATAERLCAKWLVATYMAKEGQQPLRKADLFLEAQKQPDWGTDLRGEKAFDRAWANAIAAGPYEAWTEGGDTRRGRA